VTSSSKAKNATGSMFDCFDGTVVGQQLEKVLE
jgi:hypothetical protein